MDESTKVNQKDEKVSARWIAWIIGPFIGLFTQTMPESWGQAKVFLVLAIGIALIFVWSSIA